LILEQEFKEHSLGGSMTYTVTRTSRGSAYVTDGIKDYRVDAEGLHGDKDGDADYVLYKDSIRCITCPENSSVSDEVAMNIINAIVAKFSETNMKVDVV